MSVYRTRPVEPVTVDARRVSGGTAKEIAEWCGAFVYTGSQHGHTTPPFKLHTCITLPGQAAYSGYWVVKNPDGTFEVHNPEDFEAKYEPEPSGARGRVEP